MRERFAVALLLLATAIPAAAKESLPFIENDFTRAVAQGTSRNRPIFVEAWAPW